MRTRRKYIVAVLSLIHAVLGLPVVTMAAMGGGGAVPGTLADSTGGTLRAWGDNTSGQLTVPSGSFTAVAASGNNGLAVRTDGSLAAWGRYENGETSVTPAGYDYVAVATSDSISAALRQDGSVAIWCKSNWESYLPTLALPAGTYQSISVGHENVLALRTDGSLVNRYIYGSNVWAPSGNTFTAVSSHDYGNIALTSLGTAEGWQYNYDMDWYDVPARSDYAAIANYGNNTGVAVLKNGSLLGFGSNQYGQLTNLPGAYDFTAAALGYDFGLGLRTDGSLSAWGKNAAITSVVPTGTFASIAAGNFFAVALEADGEKRTAYSGDLLVSGPMGSIKTRLDRSIAVSGNMAIIGTEMTIESTPVAQVVGKLTLDNASATGTGFLDIGGELVVMPNGGRFNYADVTAGSLRGSGSLYLDQARLSVGPGRYYTGALTADASVVELQGTGNFSAGTVTLISDGELRLASGQRMLLNSPDASMISRGGTLHVDGAATARSEIEFRGPVSSISMVTGRHATLRFAAGLENSGTLAVTEGANYIHGNISNTGRIAVTSGATATFYGNIEQNGTFVVDASATMISRATLLGTLSGTGTISGGGEVFLVGNLSPGNSPGAMNMDVDLILGPTAVTTMELGGTSPGIGYDQVNIAGNLTADGTLNVVLYGGFQPLPGDSFNLLNYGAKIGGFDQVTLPVLADGMTWDLSYTDSNMYLTVVPEPTSLVMVGLAVGLLMRRTRRR